METRFKPITPHYKILITVYELNERDIYPLPKGVYRILMGKETEYSDLHSFGSITSYPQKKISRFILMLVRYGYLKKIYDEKSDKMYLTTTEFGEATAVKYLTKHQNPFHKHKKEKEVLFIKMEKKR